MQLGLERGDNDAFSLRSDSKEDEENRKSDCRKTPSFISKFISSFLGILQFHDEF